MFNGFDVPTDDMVTAGQFVRGQVEYFIDEMGSDLIIYRNVDLPLSEKRRKSPLDGISVRNEEEEEEEEKSGHLEPIKEGNVCEMLIVVDAGIYKILGGNVSKVAGLVARLVEAVNGIYRNQVVTLVGSRLKSVELRVAKMIVGSKSLCGNEKKNVPPFICHPEYTDLSDPDAYLRAFALYDHSK